MDRLCLRFASACGVAIMAVHGAGAQSPADKPVVVQGQCTYSDRLAPPREQNHFFAECDRMETLDRNGKVEIKFAFPARLRSVEFRGTFALQSRLEVSAIRLRSQRDWQEAEGQCDFSQTASNDYTVTCLVKDGPRFYVVNFTPDPRR